MNFIAEIFYSEYGLVEGYLIIEALVRFLFRGYMEGTTGFNDAIITKTNYAYALLTQEVSNFDELVKFDAA